MANYQTACAFTCNQGHGGSHTGMVPFLNSSPRKENAGGEEDKQKQLNQIKKNLHSRPKQQHHGETKTGSIHWQAEAGTSNIAEAA
jgi:hypothetical protein